MSRDKFINTRMFQILLNPEVKYGNIDLWLECATELAKSEIKI